jgi:transposase
VVKLKAKEVVQLEEVWRTATETRPLQRAQALVWLEEGESVEEGADRLPVTPQSVSNWLARFGARADREREERGRDGPRSGRLRTAVEIMEPVLDAVIETDPRELGYHSPVWTAPLFQHYLAKVGQREVSTKSVSRALVRLRIHWKRPRPRLAVREPDWRQAKGGSNRGWGGRSARAG